MRMGSSSMRTGGTSMRIWSRIIGSGAGADVNGYAHPAVGSAGVVLPQAQQADTDELPPPPPRDDGGGVSEGRPSGAINFSRRLVRAAMKAALERGIDDEPSAEAEWLEQQRELEQPRQLKESLPQQQSGSLPGKQRKRTSFTDDSQDTPTCAPAPCCSTAGPCGGSHCCSICSPLAALNDRWTRSAYEGLVVMNDLTHQGHYTWVLSVAVSPDGRKLFTGAFGAAEAPKPSSVSPDGRKRVSLADMVADAKKQAAIDHVAERAGSRPYLSPVSRLRGDSPILMWNVGTSEVSALCIGPRCLTPYTHPTPSLELALRLNPCRPAHPDSSCTRLSPWPR